MVVPACGYAPAAQDSLMTTIHLWRSGSIEHNKRYTGIDLKFICQDTTTTYFTSRPPNPLAPDLHSRSQLPSRRPQTPPSYCQQALLNDSTPHNPQQTALPSKVNQPRERWKSARTCRRIIAEPCVKDQRDQGGSAWPSVILSSMVVAHLHSLLIASSLLASLICSLHSSLPFR